MLRLAQARASSVFAPQPVTEDCPQPRIKALIEQYCPGRGVEIGPGKHPYCNAARTVFLDKHTNNKDGTPSPDIVSDAWQVPVTDTQFDFLFSSHCLEHCPNTLKTLYEWKRVMKPGGTMFLILPHGDRTFDRYRAKTTLQHHISDFEALNDAPDYSHVEEIKAGWSKNADFEAGKTRYEAEWAASVWDFDFRIKNGVIHYHVWTQNEMIDLLKFIGLRILYVMDIVPERNDSFLVIARK